MDWTEYASNIQELPNLKGEPVAITYSMHRAFGALKGKHRICDSLLLANNGETIDLTLNTCACPGGSWHVGLGQYPEGEQFKVAQDFLVKREKIYCSIAVFHRMKTLNPPPPTGLADHIVLAPLRKAEFQPDAVLFICNAEQACRLVTLDSYETGIAPKVQMSGSTCYQTITYPVVSGELNVSLMDYTSRQIRGFKPEDMVVSIPYNRFLNIIRNADKCAAGRADILMPQPVLAALSEYYNWAVPIAAGYRKSEDWLRKYSNVVKGYLRKVA